MKNILVFEWKLFFRNKIGVLLWLLLLIAGIYSVFYGKSYQTKQLSTKAQLDSGYTSRLKRQLDSFSADTTTKEGKEAYKYATDPFLNEYRLGLNVWKQPNPLQSLSIGQSDNQPFYYRLWVYSNVYLSKQIELRNPDKLLAGNFDLSFVFIYLFPLLIIVYTYSLISNDKESGIASLLLAQGISISKILHARLLFRFFLIISLAILLTLIGYLLNSIPFSTFIIWLAIVTVYILFWFVIAYIVLSFKKSSGISALILVSAWTLFLIFIPSIINNLDKAEDHERLKISDISREYSNQLWEMKKTALIDTLYRIKPEWASYSIKDTNEVRSVAYSYLDMIKLNNEGYLTDSLIMANQKRLQIFDYINPAYSIQKAFNVLAETELDFYLNFRKKAADYYVNRSETINKYRLSGMNFGRKDFEAFPSFNQPEYPTLLWIGSVIPVIALTIVLAATGIFLWRRKPEY